MGMAKTDSTFYFRSKIIIVLTTTDSNTVGTGKCQYWRSWSLNFRILFHNIIITINNITTLFSIVIIIIIRIKMLNVFSVTVGDHHLSHGIYLTNVICQRFNKSPPSRSQHLKCRVTGKQISKGSHYEFTKFQKEIQ